jgi:hypothetical protein
MALRPAEPTLVLGAAKVRFPPDFHACSHHISTSMTGSVTSHATAPCWISIRSASERTDVRKCTLVVSGTASPRFDEMVSR